MVGAGVALLHPASAHAEDADPPGPGADGEADRAFERLSQPLEGYARVVSTLGFGEGIRFNNPYRLQTQLGERGESLSLTAGYIDLGVAVSFGPPDGIQHGGALHLSASLTGVSQQVLTPSYFVTYRGPHRVLGYGRLGPAIILSPDAGVGAEMGLAGGLFLTGKIALYAELTGNLFYGAGTFDVKYAVYPILSGQLGLMIDHELLP